MSTRTMHLAAAMIPLARVGALPRRREGSADVAELGSPQRQQGAAPAAPCRTSEGTASARRINAAPLPVRCVYFPSCTYTEGECADLCDSLETGDHP